MVACALLATACGSSDRAADELGGSEASTAEARIDDVADRVRSLGQRGLAVTPKAQLERLGRGRAPDPDAPLFVGDYADPFVLAVGPSLYLYSTNTLDANVPVLSAESGELAVPVGDALPELPEWTTPGLVWAPSVLAVDGGYALYYTTLHVESGLQCIGAAHATEPTGPFVDDSDEPFVCQLELGGTIDASPFESSDGRRWLLYKSDGNCCDTLTVLWIRELTPDGLGFVGDPVPLLRTTEPWEGPLIEGPSMSEYDGRFYLMYSANDWNSADYATGLATCETPTGPCRKQLGPWLRTHGDASGPGGAEQFTDAEGRRWAVYHAWVGEDIGYLDGGVRALFVVRLDTDEGRLVARGVN